MKKSASRIITIIFLCLMPVWMFASKDVKFSEKENRYMATFPKISAETVKNGSFMTDFETYLTDQFPVRDACIALKTNTLRLFGQRRINGVYIASNGYLIAGEEEFNEQKVEELTKSINKFAANLDKDVDVNFMLVPNAVSIYEAKLPYNVKSTQRDTMDFVKDNLSDKIRFVDVYDTLKDNVSQQLYYKTDHHWTTRGAFAAFMDYAKAVGLDTDSVDYDFMSVAGDFQGTQASNCGIYSSYDNVNICVPRNGEGSYVVNYIEKTEKKATLFDESKLGEKDKYLVFMGGNYSEVDITTNAGTGKNLLVIKDSYANCMIPMLTPYYDHIIVVDPRYYYDDIYELVRGSGITDVLFLYNVNSYVTDNSLEDILNNIPSQDAE